MKDSYSERIRNYARENYRLMCKEPGDKLRYPFIVPGSCYSNELWDWDSWLTDIALHQLAAENGNEDITRFEQGCILNFLDHADESGKIPIFITKTAVFPSYDKETNIHKPCLAQHAAFIVKSDTGNGDWLRSAFPKLKKFVRFYMENCRHESGLYFWIDDCAIGVDNDPSTFYRPNKSSASILLNCFMYKELLAMDYLCQVLNEDGDTFLSEAEHLKQAIQDCCYDEKDGLFYSCDLNLRPINKNEWLHSGHPRHWSTLIQRIGCWASFLPLWAGIATKAQAERMVKENLLDPRTFCSPWGVRSLAKTEKMFDVYEGGNPSCWLGAIWGISNYLVFRGLVDYGFEVEARSLAEKTVTLFGRDLEETGTLHEYYNDETGAPVIHPGFQNWNLLSLNMIAWLEGREVVREF